MPDQFTPAFGLTLPEVGSSRDTWGTKLNQNFTTLDTFLAYAMPIGAVLDFCGINAPAGWLIADGRLISRTTYSQLFAVIGTYFGAGDGSTTFGLPNLNGRSTIGPGSATDQGGHGYSYAFAAIAGFVWNTIAQSNLPNYNLVTDAQGVHSHGGATAPGGNHLHYTDAQGDHSHTGYTDAQGNHSHGVNDPSHAHGYTTLTTATGAAYNAAGWQSVTGSTGATTTYSTTGISIQVAGNHQHNIQTYNAGSHAHNISYSGNLQLGIYADGSHQHNVALGGGGQAFTVLGPILVVTKIIYAGQQAHAVAVGGGVEAGPLIEGNALDLEDEILDLRNEVAALRASLGQLRIRHAPMRGAH